MPAPKKYKASIVGFVEKTEKNQIYLHIRERYWPATLHLDKFSHAIILWWITGHDNAESRANLQDPPPQPDAEISGVFASRSPARPTPIGLSIVAIIEFDQKNHRIQIDQIDAFEGTPIIDIKPYMPSSDRVDNARVAPWFRNNIKRYTT